MMIIIGPKTRKGAIAPPFAYRTSARIGATTPAKKATTQPKTALKRPYTDQPRRTRNIREVHEKAQGVCDTLLEKSDWGDQGRIMFLASPRTSQACHDAGASQSHSPVLGRVELRRNEIHDRPRNGCEDGGFTETGVQSSSCVDRQPPSVLPSKRHNPSLNTGTGGNISAKYTF